MKLKVMISCVVLVGWGVFSTVAADGQGGGKRLLLNFVGTGPMYPGTVPDINGDSVDDSAICFDAQLIDARNRQVIGSATDCLVPTESPASAGGPAVKLVGTTFFHLPQGTLISRGMTTVQPVLQPTVTPDGHAITHITGASGTGNAIIGGTQRFANATGTVRLSGMVNLSSFAGNPGDPIFFDCLFLVDLD